MMAFPMPDTSTIEELIERVERVVDRDDDLNYALTQFVDPGAVRYSSAHLDYTGSIDAALALAERMFGTDAPSLLYNYDLGWHASSLAEMAFTADLHLAVGTPPDMREYHGQSYTLPLAILLATLRALQGSMGE